MATKGKKQTKMGKPLKTETLKIRVTPELLKLIELQKQTPMYQFYSDSDIIHESIAKTARGALNERPEIISKENLYKTIGQLYKTIYPSIEVW